MKSLKITAAIVAALSVSSLAEAAIAYAPEPTPVTLFGLGLVAVGLVRYFRKTK